MLILASAVVLLLVLLNGVFAMSELAIVSARTAQLRMAAERGSRGAKVALELGVTLPKRPRLEIALDASKSSMSQSSKTSNP